MVQPVHVHVSKKSDSILYETSRGTTDNLNNFQQRQPKPFHPMYQYALNEYAQTVPTGSSNDSGSRNTMDMGESSSCDPVQVSVSTHASRASVSVPLATATTAASAAASMRSALPFDANNIDTTYEEYYGDAYTGGSIKYLYPSGYQSMRPRSCPWKISILVCMLFTWLSVFIVGHCSDQSNAQSYRNDELDDRVYDIDIRWCGSRPLYLMWVAAMLITGISAAYCSIIGYIKVRDFAVGNVRSIPANTGPAQNNRRNVNSDYYVHISESGDGGPRSVVSEVSGVYRQSIYQSDGTPQFWGSFIRRPTQAAVAITSR
jgi:hypothetical protein